MSPRRSFQLRLRAKIDPTSLFAAVFFLRLATMPTAFFGLKYIALWLDTPCHNGYFYIDRRVGHKNCLHLELTISEGSGHVTKDRRQRAEGRGNRPGRPQGFHPKGLSPDHHGRDRRRSGDGQGYTV